MTSISPSLAVPGLTRSLKLGISLSSFKSVDL